MNQSIELINGMNQWNVYLDSRNLLQLMMSWAMANDWWLKRHQLTHSILLRDLNRSDLPSPFGKRMYSYSKFKCFNWANQFTLKKILSFVPKNKMYDVLKWGKQAPKDENKCEKKAGVRKKGGKAPWDKKRHKKKFTLTLVSPAKPWASWTCLWTTSLKTSPPRHPDWLTTTRNLPSQLGKYKLLFVSSCPANLQNMLSVRKLRQLPSTPAEIKVFVLHN